MKTLLICTLSLCSLLVAACGDDDPAGPVEEESPALSHAWSTRFGDPGAQTVTGLAVDASGAIILSGRFSGELDLGGGPLPDADGVYVAKFASDGTHVWSRSYAGGSLLGPEIACDANGSVLAVGVLEGSVDFGGGVLSSAGGADVYLAKFNSDGDHVWSKRFGDSSDQVPHAVAVNTAGNLCISGRFQGSVNFGGSTLASAGLGDLFLVKFDAGGVHSWSRRFGDTSDQLSMLAEFDPSGNIITCGDYTGVLNFGGWILTAQGPRDMYIVKLTSAGDGDWGLGFSTTAGGGMYAGDVAVSTAGEILVTGEFEGVQFGGTTLTGGILGAKIGPDGDVAWALAFGGDVNAAPKSVAVDNDGSALFTGGFTGSVDFGGGKRDSNCQSDPCDVYLAKLHRLGGHLWSARFGDGAGVEGREIAVDADGDVVTAGVFKGELDFGGGPLTSAGDWDIYLARFNVPAQE